MTTTILPGIGGLSVGMMTEALTTAGPAETAAPAAAPPALPLPLAIASNGAANSRTAEAAAARTSEVDFVRDARMGILLDRGKEIDFCAFDFAARLSLHGVRPAKRNDVRGWFTAGASDSAARHSRGQSAPPRASLRRALAANGVRLTPLA